MLSLSEFENFYSSEDSLPVDRLIEDYDDQIFDLFRKGKEVFFEPLKKDFLSIYNFIINNCSELVLIEEKGPREFLYSWALSTDKKYLKSNIPFGYRLNNVFIAEEEFYEAVPSPLRPFYYAFNGFDINNIPYAGIEDEGFLRAMTSWPSVDEALNDRASQKAMADHIKYNFPESDLRVICFGLGEDALVIDVENKYTGLFQVKNNPISYYKMENHEITSYITEIFFENFK
jgi:hypothetical protein